MSLTLRDIQYFLVVARTGLLATAAIECGVTQPALTKAMKRIEAEFGLGLFERNARGMRLTSSGLRFVDQARRLNADYADTMLLVNEMRMQNAGLLRIGVTDTSAGNLITPTLAALIPKRPGLRISLKIDRSDALATEVLNGDLDLALVPLYEDQPFEGERTKIDTDSMFPLVRTGHPLTRKARVLMSDLTPYGWILGSPTSVAFGVVNEIFQRHKLPPPRVVVEIPHASEATLSLLASTDLISLVPASILRHTDNERFFVLPVAQLRVPRTVVLLSRPGSSWSSLMETFKETLLEQKRLVTKFPGCQGQPLS